MERTSVESSNILSVGHDPKENVLEVEFYNGSIYQYSPFTEEGYKLFINSESLGKFMHKHIRNNDSIKAEKVSWFWPLFRFNDD